MGKRTRALVAMIGLLGLVAAACTTTETSTPPTTGEKGGTVRFEADELPWKSSFGGFDPTVEWFQVTFSLYSNLLLRPLMNYNHRGVDEGGNTPRPDLAAGPPEVSDDGLSYTYTLRDGVMFSPPVNREVTSQDVAYAFERLATKSLSADAGSYAEYYRDLIEGFKAFEDGDADSISGIETPDEKTITFNLTEVAGDFDYRVSMPATAPIPEEVAGCFKQPLEYGQYFVSTGPYMIEGMEALDTSDCKALKAKKPSGFDVESHMYLVRNTNFDEATEVPELRSSLPDRFEIRENTNTKNIFDKIQRNEVDFAIASVPADVLQKYSGNSQLEPLLHLEPDDATWYLTMDLTLPPFDDVNVRRAANFIMDKEALIRVWGGPAKGIPAEHIIPPNVLNGLLAPGEFDPFASENHAGDLEKAKAEMAKSSYDTDGDGICDAAACKNVRHITRNTDPFPNLARQIEESFAKIGITLNTREVESFYGTAGDVTKRGALTSGGGWGKDWADPITFIKPLFSGAGIGPAGNVNLSLFGLTAEQAADLNIDYPEGGVPNVEDEIEQCSALPGGDARYQCWADLDKKVTEEYAPWIPYRWSQATHVTSEAVVGWDFDSFASYPSFAHIGIDPSKQV